MVPSEDMGSLALYLQKQREARLISEELDRLKSNETVEAAIRIKHEIEALMADYELSPEQLLEAMCLLFDLAKPKGFDSTDLLPGEPTASEAGAKPTQSKKERSAKPDKRHSRNSRRNQKEKKSPVNEAMTPAKKVTILTPEQRQQQAAQKKAGGAVEPAVAPKKDESLAAKPPRRKPRSSAEPAVKPRPRSKRSYKIYTNPHSGEVVRTRGANHRTLNQWRLEHGREAVDSWWQWESA